MFHWSSIFSAFWLFQLVERVEVAEGFSPLHRSGGKIIGSGEGASRVRVAHASRIGGLYSSSANTDPHQVEDSEDWSDERKSSLFQFLLRDLEVEGVPLLGCDGVSSNNTLHGATWTIAGQLSENEYERKVCLVLEDIPVKNLKMFVNNFSELKTTQQSTMDALHDLRRFSMSLVGNGIGPALILETANKTMNEIAEYSAMVENTAAPNEPQWKEAMESFVKRCFPQLEKDPIAYRFLGSSDICDILSGYWNCICELEASDATQSNSIVLSFPPSSEKKTHTRFVAISELLNTMNSLYKSEYNYYLVYFHPSYDRDEIQPQNEPVNGHLSPTSILRDMIRQNGNEELSDEQLTLRNYQRRSPLPGVIIKRVSEESEVENCQSDYQNAIRLAKEGEGELREALMEEIQLIN